MARHLMRVLSDLSFDDYLEAAEPASVKEPDAT
jgi:hypothetical protein